nr:potassium channel family protein [Acuticoccus mangrovi]
MTGVTVNVAVTLIHLAATLLLIVLFPYFERVIRNNHTAHLVISLVVVNFILLNAHVVEVGIWAAVYLHLGLVEQAEDAFYSAFVNYTTLGYGDVVHTTPARLMSPMTAGSGIMMFGWSTALLIYVLQLHLPRLRRRDGER